MVFAQDSKLEKIGRCAFERSGIESFVAPAALRAIEDSAFDDCQYLKTVELNEGLERIGDSCFREDTFERVEIPRSVRVIGADSFRGCRSLRVASFQEGSTLERVGESAFR